jgi:hypothetical protein
MRLLYYAFLHNVHEEGVTASPRRSVCLLPVGNCWTDINEILWQLEAIPDTHTVSYIGNENVTEATEPSRQPLTLPASSRHAENSNHCGDIYQSSTRSDK